MNDLFAVVLTLLFIAIVAFLVIKKYNAVFVFLASGMLVLMIFSLITGNSILADDTKGNVVVDVFVFAIDKFKSNASGVGLTLMMVTGYAVYMSHIGASTKLAYLATKPLSKIKNPYVVLSLLFVIGTMLKLVITSHSALGMLLMAIAFPILISLGVSRLSAATVMIMSGFVDWGPNDSSAIFAAEKVVGMPMIDYFLKYQMKAAIILIIICAIFLPVYLQFMDKREKAAGGDIEKGSELKDVSCPAFYAVFPTIPLVLVTVFSFIPSITIDVLTANLISLLFVFVFELLRRKDRKEVTMEFVVFFKAMGTSFASVVSILIGAAVFAEAIKTLGGINVISTSLAAIKSAPVITRFLMALITFLAGILLGSGNASWYAFGPLVPDVATKIGVPIAAIALPMQLASGIGRSTSLVSGVVIAIAGMAELEITDIAKRCAVPAIVMFFCNIIISCILV